uniref:Putative secreted protein n=1 Tax=Anopheles darlingi TaxID=43151 RepID=A0A2M4DL46_ANODA
MLMKMMLIMMLLVAVSCCGSALKSQQFQRRPLKSLRSVMPYLLPATNACQQHEETSLWFLKSFSYARHLLAEWIGRLLVGDNSKTSTETTEVTHIHTHTHEKKVHEKSKESSKTRKEGMRSSQPSSSVALRVRQMMPLSIN